MFRLLVPHFSTKNRHPFPPESTGLQWHSPHRKWCLVNGGSFGATWGAPVWMSVVYIVMFWFSKIESKAGSTGKKWTQMASLEQKQMKRLPSLRYFPCEKATKRYFSTGNYRFFRFFLWNFGIQKKNIIPNLGKFHHDHSLPVWNCLPGFPENWEFWPQNPWNKQGLV